MPMPMPMKDPRLLQQRPYYYLGGHRGLTRLSSGEPFIVSAAARDVATWIILDGAWETHVDDVLMGFVRPGDVAIDVGANMGYYSVKLGTRIGETGRLYAFEPNGDLADVLFENIRINDLRHRTTLFRAAAGDVAEKARLIYMANFPGGGRVLPPKRGPTKGYSTAEIEIVVIDDVLADLDRVDLIKLDVEGFESRVLLGAKNLLDRSPDAVVVTEFVWDAWKKTGDPVRLLDDVARGRRLFHIGKDASLSEIRPEEREARLASGGMMYLLLVPQTPGRLAQLEALTGRRGKGGRGGRRGALSRALRRGAGRWTALLR